MLLRACVLKSTSRQMQQTSHQIHELCCIDMTHACHETLGDAIQKHIIIKSQLPCNDKSCRKLVTNKNHW